MDDNSSKLEQTLQLWSVREVNVLVVLVAVVIIGMLMFAATVDPSMTHVDVVFASAVVVLYIAGMLDAVRTSTLFRMGGATMIGLFGSYMILTASKGASLVLGGYLLFTVGILTARRTGLIE